DFNNVLTAVLGSIELLLLDAPPDRPHREELDIIRDAATRAKDLIRQLLAFSARQVLQPMVIDLNHLVKDVAKMLRRLIGEDVPLETTLAPGLGAVRVDAGQIEQVLVNLAVNARDAMPQGGRLAIATGNVELDGTRASPAAPVPWARPPQATRRSWSPRMNGWFGCWRRRCSSGRATAWWWPSAGPTRWRWPSATLVRFICSSPTS